MDIAADRTFVTDKWKWRWSGRLPFEPQPPLDRPDALSQYFVGRANEIDRAFRTVFYGQTLMVRGSWGIGKTAFILTLLQRLSTEAEAAGESLLPVYLGAELPQVDLDHRKRYKKVVIAVDDFDKKEPREIRNVLDEAKALLRGAPCQFVLTGRSLVAPSDDFSALVLALFQTPIRLGPLSAKDLERAAVGQLNLFRTQRDDGFAPFTAQALAIAAEKSSGIPRLFNHLCRGAIEYAPARKIQTISPEVFNAALAASQEQMAVNVPYEHRRLLYLILSRHGISFYKGAEMDDVLREAGVERIWELLPHFDELVKKDLLYMAEEGGRLVIRVTPLAERAAEMGGGQR